MNRNNIFILSIIFLLSMAPHGVNAFGVVDITKDFSRNLIAQVAATIDDFLNNFTNNVTPSVDTFLNGFREKTPSSEEKIKKQTPTEQKIVDLFSGRNYFDGSEWEVEIFYNDNAYRTDNKGNADAGFLSMSDKMAVWQQYNSVTNRNDILVLQKDSLTEGPIVISTHGNAYQPKLQESVVVWQEWLDDNWEIMLYRWGGSTQRLTYNNTPDISPTMVGRAVIWEGVDPVTNNRQIFKRSLDQNATEQITSGVNDNRDIFFVGEKLAWFERGQEFVEKIFNDADTTIVSGRTFVKPVPPPLDCKKRPTRFLPECTIKEIEELKKEKAKATTESVPAGTETTSVPEASNESSETSSSASTSTPALETPATELAPAPTPAISSTPPESTSTLAESSLSPTESSPPSTTSGPTPEQTPQQTPPPTVPQGE